MPRNKQLMEIMLWDAQVYFIYMEKVLHVCFCEFVGLCSSTLSFTLLPPYFFCFLSAVPYGVLIAMCCVHLERQYVYILRCFEYVYVCVPQSNDICVCVSVYTSSMAHRVKMINSCHLVCNTLWQHYLYQSHRKYKS